MDLLLSTVLTGVGATVVIDAWALLRRRWLGIPLLDYAMLGRWIGHMPRGRFLHHSKAPSPPIAGERMLGWITHYLTGIAFAGLLLAAGGRGWFCQPTLGLALAVGIGSAVAPFFIMQPAFGLGIAASRSPRPAMTRAHSLLTHAIFGLGLYVAGWLLQALPVRVLC